MAKKRAKNSYPPGTIGVISGELGRWTAFSQSLWGTWLPEGIQKLWLESHWIPGAVNEIIAKMKPESEWVTIVSDDHTWDPFLFQRLLERNVDLVAPVVHLRRDQFPPSAFHALPDGQYQCYEWQELDGQDGLVPVDTFGGPCAIIRRPVLEALGDPWFQNQPGQLVYPHDDLYFFNRARLAGFQPYLDLDNAITHCFAARGLPVRLEDGTYGIQIIANGAVVGVVKPQPTTVNAAEAYHAYT